MKAKFGIPVTRGEARALSRLLILVHRFPGHRVADLLTEADLEFMKIMSERAERLVLVATDGSDQDGQ